MSDTVWLERKKASHPLEPHASQNNIARSALTSHHFNAALRALVGDSILVFKSGAMRINSAFAGRLDEP